MAGEYSSFPKLQNLQTVTVDTVIRYQFLDSVFSKTTKTI